MILLFVGLEMPGEKKKTEMQRRLSSVLHLFSSFLLLQNAESYHEGHAYAGLYFAEIVVLNDAADDDVNEKHERDPDKGNHHKVAFFPLL